MADRSSNINNAAHVVEPHITLQTSDDMKMDLNFKKPVEETKTKESIGVSMEKPHTLSKEPTKQTSRPSKSREKPEDHTQKIDDKIVDSIRPSTGDVTTTDKKPESSYKSSTISPKTSDNTKDKLDTGKASEINIESEKPLRVIDNHKKEQDKRQQNYQKVNENKLHETKVVNNADKQRSDKLNKVSEKPLRTTDTHQKGQDLKQQNYQKVSEETKTASSSSGKKVTETKPVNKAEKQPSDQKIKDDSNTNSVPKKPISNERETSGSKMEDSRIGVNDKSTTEHEKEKQPSDQMKKDDSKTDYVPMKPESNEKEIPSSRTEKYSKIGASDESTTKHKNEKQSTDETKKEDSNSNSLPQKPVSNEKEIPSSKKEKDSIIQTSDKSTVEHQTVDLKSNQKPSLDKTNAGDFSKNHKPVVQTSPEINTKKEGKLTDLEHDKQTHRVSSELNMEKTVKQNPGKVSEQQHNDKLKKEKNEKLNNVIDKSSVYKRDDSQQGKVPSGNDKTVKTEKVKKNVASQAPDKSHQTAKSKLEPDENEDKDEDGDSGIEADETDTIGVALKFGVGVALVIVAHVVLVRKWNSDEDTVPPQTPTVPSPRISAEVPRIVETSAEQEDFVEDEPEKSITSELVVRRQTLLPEELAQSFENRKREDSASSGGTEEDIEDDGQEVRIFKMNVLSAELPVKEERSFKDEKPFKEDRMFKVESFEELMKKYRQLTPEGSDLEYEDEEEEEEDGAELDEEEVDEEEEEEDLEDDEDNLPEQTLPGKPNITTMKNIRDHESNSEDEEVEEDYDDDKQSKLKMENESEDDESEEEDEEDEEEDEEEDGQELFRQKEKQKPSYSKYQQNISDEEDTDERPAPTLSKFSKGPGGEKAQNYVNYDITSDDDWNLIDELDKAAAEKPEVAIFMFDLILKSHPNSPRAWYGKATALDQLAEMQQSNHILEQAIEAFKKVVALGPAVKDKLLLQAAQRCIERMRFKGQHLKAVAVHQALISRFPNNSQFQNQLAVTYLMINRIQEAKRVLEKVLQNWKNDGFAQVHYGFILKTSGNNLEEAVKYLRNGIATREPGTIDGRFFFQLGDALQRLGRKDEAMEVYEMGVQEKLFLSKYQRSLYNVDRLRAQPWWTPEQTTYVTLFNTLKNKWTEIRREGLTAFYEKDINLFQDESENLKDSGKWQQLELYARGRKIQKNCLKAPLTCQLIDAFPMARDCKRGQVKFSVMHAGTHVWPHCGPTNCRLRSHLGLVVPSGTYIRVADETRSWKEGDFIIFDDSFEHEVWHNGTSTRLVLIVDVWHPELSEEEKRTMAAI